MLAAVVFLAYGVLGSAGMIALARLMERRGYGIEESTNDCPELRTEEEASMEVVTEAISWNLSGGKPKYDWEMLFDGQVWQLDRGEDFDCIPANFRSSVYRAAKVRGIKARVKIAGSTVYVQRKEIGVLYPTPLPRELSENEIASNALAAALGVH